ncbi:hypothetical protein B484DRAFT_439863, partial [Ochromonadaceae sp. CCMP2298]
MMLEDNTESIESDREDEQQATEMLLPPPAISKYAGRATRGKQKQLTLGDRNEAGVAQRKPRSDKDKAFYTSRRQVKRQKAKIDEMQEQINSADARAQILIEAAGKRRRVHTEPGALTSATNFAIMQNSEHIISTNMESRKTAKLCAKVAARKRSLRRGSYRTVTRLVHGKPTVQRYWVRPDAVRLPTSAYRTLEGEEVGCALSLANGAEPGEVVCEFVGDVVKESDYVENGLGVTLPDGN